MSHSNRPVEIAPIALFVYNRPDHTRAVVDALLQNDLVADSDLYVFSDGSKSSNDEAAVERVRRYVGTIRGFRSVEIHERPSNAGLAKSIIDGVTRVCNSRGRVIVLEDDLVTSRWFLRYMNDALDLYAADQEVASIHGYGFPARVKLPETFFLRGADCWGWGTWQRAWQHFEPNGAKLLSSLLQQKLDKAFDMRGAYGFTTMLNDQVAGKNDSWAVRWHASCFLAGKLTLYPGRSLLMNIGNDGSGTHSAASDGFRVLLTDSPIQVSRIALEPHEQASLAFADFLRGTRTRRFHRVTEKILKRMWLALSRG